MAPLVRLPPPPFLGAIARRSVVLWIGVRGLLAIVGGVRLAPVAAAAVVVLTAGLLELDCRRRHEELFLANLGVASATLFVLGAIAPTLAEVTVALVLGR